MQQVFHVCFFVNAREKKNARLEVMTRRKEADFKFLPQSADLHQQSEQSHR